MFDLIFTIVDQPPVEDLGIELPANFAVGMVFLAADETRADAARAAMQGALEDQGLPVLGWRAVPTDPSVCGEIALASLPRIEQVFFDGGEFSEAELSTKLFVARRRHGSP